MVGGGGGGGGRHKYGVTEKPPTPKILETKFL